MKIIIWFNMQNLFLIIPTSDNYRNRIIIVIIFYLLCFLDLYFIFFFLKYLANLSKNFIKCVIVDENLLFMVEVPILENRNQDRLIIEIVFIIDSIVCLDKGEVL